MAEYIEREAVLAICRKISACEWNHRVSPASWADAYNQFAEDVEEIPAADVVKVVRCKDCKHWVNCMKQLELWNRDYVLEVNTYQYHRLDFCSYGERRRSRADGNTLQE